MLPDDVRRKHRINSPSFSRRWARRAATNDCIGLRNKSTSSSNEGVTMMSITDKTPLSRGAASAEDREIGFAQVAHYFCGTSAALPRRGRWLRRSLRWPTSTKR